MLNMLPAHTRFDIEYVLLVGGGLDTTGGKGLVPNCEACQVPDSTSSTSDVSKISGPASLRSWANTCILGETRNPCYHLGMSLALHKSLQAERNEQALKGPN